MMEELLNSGIPFILAFQNLGAWLLAPMKFFSFLGTENFYVLIFPIVYWSVDAALGMRLGVMILLSSGINTIFKFIFHAPRPYWVNTEVKAFSAEPSFGLPSGHAQSAMSVWGLVGTYFRERRVWILSVFLIIGISFSRLYLAVHFPLDTALGLGIGFLLVVAFNRSWESVLAWARRQETKRQVAAAFFASLGLLAAGICVAWLLRDWEMPVAWTQNAVRAGGEALHPFSLSGLITSSATLFGLLSGAAWMAGKGGYSAEGSVSQRVFRYFLGVIGLAVFYLGLKAVFPSGETLIAYCFRYLRYSLVGFWVSGGAPFTFLKVNLANSPRG
jgi:membrane-associated phospholipid phosphatase